VSASRERFGLVPLEGMITSTHSLFRKIGHCIRFCLVSSSTNIFSAKSYSVDFFDTLANSIF
jgi:hypothetical protein